MVSSRPRRAGGRPVGRFTRFLWVLLFIILSTFVAIFIGDTGNSDDVTTAVTAVAATLNNVGPGLALVGATQNFAHMAPAAKVALSLAMVAGRLELYAILALGLPSFWRSK